VQEVFVAVAARALDVGEHLAQGIAGREQGAGDRGVHREGAVAERTEQRFGRVGDAFAAGRREEAVEAYGRWLPLINFENRQGGFLAAKALMKEGGIIACDAPRSPYPAMSPHVRAGLLDAARRLDPLVLRWGK